MLRYIHVFLIFIYPCTASSSPCWTKLVLEFCPEVERKNPSKEATLLRYTNGKTEGISTSPTKVAMQSMDAASCELEVH